MSDTKRRRRWVKIGHVQIGGGAPVVVQSMTSTDTADAAATARQCLELAEAGSELVRVTVNLPEAAAAVPEIRRAPRRRRLRRAADRRLPLQRPPAARRSTRSARACSRKYRINPGNVGHGARRDEQFATICEIARDHGKAVRIGVNGGSLNQELVMAKMQENTDRALGLSSRAGRSPSAWCCRRSQSTELALASRPRARTGSSSPARSPARAS